SAGDVRPLRLARPVCRLQGRPGALRGASARGAAAAAGDAEIHDHARRGSGGGRLGRLGPAAEAGGAEGEARAAGAEAGHGGDGRGRAVRGRAGGIRSTGDAAGPQRRRRGAAADRPVAYPKGKRAGVASRPLHCRPSAWRQVLSRRIWYRMIPPNVAVPIPPRVKPPKFSAMSPAPMVSATPTVIRLRAFGKSTLFSTQMRPAVAEIRPNTTCARPPSTGPGMVWISAPNLGEKPSR